MAEISNTSGGAPAEQALPVADLSDDEELDFVVIDERVMLKGGRSISSKRASFPFSDICPETGTADMEPITFGPRGSLYSYSTVHVSTTRKVPYTIGYVDFPNGVRVLSIVEAAAQDLACDLSVELRAQGNHWFVVPVRNDDSGGSESD